MIILNNIQHLVLLNFVIGLQEKILLGLDHVPPTFNLKQRIYGPGLTNVQRIGKATNALLLVENTGPSFHKDNDIAKPACVIVK